MVDAASAHPGVNCTVNGRAAVVRRIRWRGCSTCCARLGPDRHQGGLRRRASAARARVLVDGELVNSCLVAAAAGDGARSRRSRASRATTRPARRAAGVPRARRRAVRHLHAGHDPGGARAARARPAADRERRPRRRSPATCAAAPATCESSRPCWSAPEAAGRDAPMRSLVRHAKPHRPIPLPDIESPMTLDDFQLRRRTRSLTRSPIGDTCRASLRRRHRPDGGARRRAPAGRTLPRSVEADRAPRYRATSEGVRSGR